MKRVNIYTSFNLQNLKRRLKFKFLKKSRKHRGTRRARYMNYFSDISYIFNIYQSIFKAWLDYADFYTYVKSTYVGPENVLSLRHTDLLKFIQLGLRNTYHESNNIQKFNPTVIFYIQSYWYLSIYTICTLLVLPI